MCEGRAPPAVSTPAQQVRPPEVALDYFNPWRCQRPVVVVRGAIADSTPWPPGEAPHYYTGNAFLITQDKNNIVRNKESASL